MVKIKDHFRGLKINSDMVKENKRLQEELTISSVIIEGMPNGEEKLVMYFEEVEESLVLNKTNGGIISDALGDDTDEWKGSKVVLTTHKVPYQGKTVNAVTIKEAKKGK